MAISAGAGYALWHSLVTGYASSNQGNFLRAEQPVRYWLTVAVLAFGYLVVLAVLFFGGHGTRS
jgi:nitrate reductase NapE component